MSISLIRAAMVLVFALCLSVPWQAEAQRGAPSATPAASPVAVGERLDLAAMALDSTDIPPEFQLFFETYLDPIQVGQQLVGEQVEQSEIDETGLLWFYQSIYSTPEGTSTIRSYLEEFADQQGAVLGFELFEDEPRYLPDAALTDEPGPGIGEEPSEITIGSYEESAPASGPTTIDVTFRVGRIIAGVSMDTQEGIAIDRDLMLVLAERLESRITAVLGGQPLPLIDGTIPERYVQLGDGWDVTNEGYWSIPEVYGPQAAPEIVAGLESGYTRADAYDPNNLGGFPIPRVAIGVAQFNSEPAALSLLSALDLLQPAFTLLEAVDIDPVPGSSVTLGYQFANTFFSDATVDSFRIVMLAGTSVVTVDVQGNQTADAAQAAALEIATAQAACLASNQPCDVESFPSELFTPSATPEAGNPVG